MTRKKAKTPSPYLYVPVRTVNGFYRYRRSRRETVVTAYTSLQNPDMLGGDVKVYKLVEVKKLKITRELI